MNSLPRRFRVTEMAQRVETSYYDYVSASPRTSYAPKRKSAIDRRGARGDDKSQNRACNCVKRHSQRFRAGCVINTMSTAYAKLFFFCRQLPAPRPTSATSPAPNSITAAGSGTAVSVLRVPRIVALPSASSNTMRQFFVLKEERSGGVVGNR